MSISKFKHLAQGVSDEWDVLDETSDFITVESQTTGCKITYWDNRTIRISPKAMKQAHQKKFPTIELESLLLDWRHYYDQMVKSSSKSTVVAIIGDNELNELEIAQHEYNRQKQEVEELQEALKIAEEELAMRAKMLKELKLTFKK